MKRPIICTIVLLSVLFIISGCTEHKETAAGDPTVDLDPTENVSLDQNDGINPTDSNKYIIQTPFYQIYEEDVQVYKYRIASGDHILVEDVKTGTAPQIVDKDNGILKLHLGFGINAFTVKYFNIYSNTVSEEFHPCSIYADYVDTANKEYYIAYFKLEEKPKLYINGFFNSSEFSNQLDLNFAMATCEKLIFLNETEIYVEYIDSNSENIKRVINFRDSAECTDLDNDTVKKLYSKFITNEITAFDESNVKKHFRDYLLWEIDEHDYMYTYLDITGDSIPELCVRQYPMMYFFTAKNGEIYHWYTEDNSYVKLLNNGALLFERHGGAPTHINYEYYELDKNANRKLTASFSWWDGATIEFGKVYPDVYIFDDKEVTRQEYEEKTKAYLSIGNDKLVWYDMDGNQK